MSKTRVVLHPRHPHGFPEALSAAPGVELVRPADDDGVAAALRDGGEVLATYTWRDDFLTPSLRWIAGAGAGYEQYPLERFAEHGIVLTTATGLHAGTVAEHAFALLLALTRRVGEAVRHMGEAAWVPLVGEEMAGKRMAIVGLGRIGEAVARRAQGWDMELAGLKRRPEAYAGCLADVRGPDALPALCEWADIVMLTAPANPDGSPMIGRRELDLLGEGWLVNVGRGSLVDPEALLEALETGRLRGAGLDVTSPEPLPADSALWRSPKVVVSAHNAAASPGFAERWGRMFEANLEALRGGAEWTNRLELAG